MPTYTFRKIAGPMLLVLLLALSIRPAQAQLGVAGGLNFESAGDIEVSVQAADSDVAFDNSTGYHIGVVYGLGSGPVSLRPGFFFRRVGTYEFSQALLPSLEDRRFDVTAFEIPVDVRAELLSKSLISPYLLGGPMVTIPRGEGDFDDATESLSLSGNVGGGVEISLGAVKLQPELRYEFGVTRFIKDNFEIAGQEFDPQDEPRFSAFSVRLNVVF